MDARTDDGVAEADGRLLAGRYRIRGRLGAGAMGVVWLALDERLDRLVAVKQLLPAGAESGDSTQRVMREGRIAARLRHPHAVTVHDVVEHDGQPVLVMEYLPSRSLAAVLAERGTLPAKTVARMGAQAASALAAAHAAGIVHRDVKPGNLLVGDDGTVKIADFGVSHAAGDVAVTRTGIVAGTPAYLATEVARGQPPTPDSDVFALGSTLYAATEGTPPFGEDTGNAIALLHQVAAGHIPPPRRAGELTPVLLAMLRPEPAQRPTAQQVADALQAIADGRPVEPLALRLAEAETQPVASPSPAAVPVAHGDGGHPATRPGPRWGARRRLLLAGAGLLAVVVVVVAAILPIRQTGDQPATASPTTAVPSPPPLEPAAMTHAVAAYYALLPARPDQAWTRLGPALQAQGEHTYRAYWSRITELTITAPPRSDGGGVVTVGIRLTLDNGTAITETHELGLVPGTPEPLINSDKLISAETSAPLPPPSTRATSARPPSRGAPVPTEPAAEKGDGGKEQKGEPKKKGEER